MATKKVKIRVKKKKINYKRIIIALLLIALICSLVAYVIKLPIKNIYITGNEIISDKEIITISKLEGYPEYINTYFMNIEDDLLKNSYIKNVKIKRELFNKIYIDIEEYKPLAIYNDKLILSSKKQVENDYNIDYVPYIINNIDSVYDRFVECFSKVDKNALLKISHIEYSPNDVDKERFIFYMVDGNYVHITLSKIEKINKYNSIVSELDGKKGIIYLDSGDYVEIKGWHKEIPII